MSSSVQNPHISDGNHTQGKRQSLYNCLCHYSFSHLTSCYSLTLFQMPWLPYGSVNRSHPRIFSSVIPSAWNVPLVIHKVLALFFLSTAQHHLRFYAFSHLFIYTSPHQNISTQNLASTRFISWVNEWYLCSLIISKVKTRTV